MHRVANAGATEAPFTLEVHPGRRIERTIRLMFATAGLFIRSRDAHDGNVFDAGG